MIRVLYLIGSIASVLLTACVLDYFPYRGRATKRCDMFKRRAIAMRVGVQLLLVLSLLVACGKKESPAPAPTPNPAPVPAPNPAPNPGPGASALPSTQGEYPGITVTIQEVKRVSNTVTLKFAVMNQSGKDFGFGYNFTEGSMSMADQGSIVGVHLVDSLNKKSYAVMRDSSGGCICSRNIATIAPGSQAVLWAKFEAPPDDVQKISVTIPHFPPFEDVPISR
jgi:hypothetical protein